MAKKVRATKRARKSRQTKRKQMKSQTRCKTARRMRGGDPQGYMICAKLFKKGLIGPNRSVKTMNECLRLENTHPEMENL